MPLPWPMVASVGGNLPEDDRQRARRALDAFGDAVAAGLQAHGLANVASPLFRAWDLIVVLDQEKLIAAFATPRGGVLEQRWVDETSRNVQPADLARQMEIAFGQPVHSLISLPRSVLEGGAAEAIEAAAVRHVDEVDVQTRLRSLGDLTLFPHLVAALTRFLADHPRPERNVFLMMSFAEDDRLRRVDRTVRRVLGDKGLDGIRADDRDYTGDLWANVETCLLGCTLGVAVFESLVEPAAERYNPNVSLELGHMLGRGRRCLILKERSLTSRPADIIHKLYRPFDEARLEETVGDELTRWIERDLRV